MARNCHSLLTVEFPLEKGFTRNGGKNSKLLAAAANARISIARSAFFPSLTLAGSGRLNGDVRVSRLSVEDGATLNGNVTMQSEKG